MCAHRRRFGEVREGSVTVPGTLGLMVRLSVVCAVLLALTASANATLPAGPIEDEQVIVVWNAQTHIERLLFRAWLGPQQGTGDITVLVPTPTTAKVSIVDDVVFERLTDAVNADIRANRTIVPYSLVYSFVDHYFTFARSPVRFVPKLESAHLASPASPLAAELEPTSDALGALADWLTPYQRDGWKLTAVRYLQPAESVLTPAPFVNKTTPELEAAVKAVAKERWGSLSEPAGFYALDLSSQIASARNLRPDQALQLRSTLVRLFDTTHEAATALGGPERAQQFRTLAEHAANALFGQ